LVRNFIVKNANFKFPALYLFFQKFKHVLNCYQERWRE